MTAAWQVSVAWGAIAIFGLLLYVAWPWAVQAWAFIKQDRGCRAIGTVTILGLWSYAAYVFFI